VGCFGIESQIEKGFTSFSFDSWEYYNNTLILISLEKKSGARQGGSHYKKKSRQISTLLS
jgi:hypothetical protein